LALTLPTSGGHTVGIVRSQTQATELIFYVLCKEGEIKKIDFANLDLIKLASSKQNGTIEMSCMI
jgi:hypothetical protein